MFRYHLFDKKTLNAIEFKEAVEKITKLTISGNIFCSCHNFPTPTGLLTPNSLLTPTGLLDLVVFVSFAPLKELRLNCEGSDMPRGSLLLGLVYKCISITDRESEYLFTMFDSNNDGNIDIAEELNIRHQY